MIRNAIKAAVGKLGYEIYRRPPVRAPRGTWSDLFEHEGIDLVLDVGANAGQFGAELRASGYSGRIVSFEPLPQPHAELTKKAALDPKWTVAPRTAIGAERTSVEINVSRNSVSSSILPMASSLSDAEPDCGYVDVETVPVNRLDDLYSLSPSDRTLIKIDVQGYEAQVLEGAPVALAGCRAVIVEMSLAPLYTGQADARHLWDALTDRGLEVWSFEPEYRHPQNRRMLQMNGAFIRSPRESQA